MRQKIVAGNWKMHGHLSANEALVEGVLAGVSVVSAGVVVCVPFPYLAQCARLLVGTPVALGAQTVSEHEKGAYTGEVSAGMLADFGCRYVIVGHSERRTLYAESDAVVAAKFVAAQAAGLTPILCVAEREAGQTAAVVLRQLDAVVARAGVGALAQAVVAYEPVWAIGTGRTATAMQAQEVHLAIRARIAAGSPEIAAGVRILYGGSVKAQNAAELFGQADIDGGLIGGAALVAEEFLAICRAAS